MPSRKTTEVLSITKKRNKHYEVATTSFTVLLDENTFTDFFLYVGKELSEKDAEDLRKAGETASIRDYAFSLLGRKRYSKAEMKDKLLGKYPNEEAVFAVINDLKEYGLINDEEYAKDYKEEKENALYGKKRITDDLRFKKRISPKIVMTLSFVNEKENAKKYLSSISKSLSSYPYITKKRKAHDILLRRGYDEESISSALESLEESDEDKVAAKLEKDAKRAYTRYQQKYEGKELRARVYSYLYRKGYESEDISTCLERMMNEH